MNFKFNLPIGHYADRLLTKIPAWLKLYLKNVKNSGPAVLAKIEQKLLKNGQSPNYAPIFIIGPPRSGTTLIYQTFTRALELSYLCNLAAKFSNSPGIVTSLISYLCKINPNNKFYSYYGETFGWNSPNQGRRMWCRWFPKNQSYVGSGIISFENKIHIRATIKLIEQAFDIPFINKAQGHSVRMLPLVEIFPEAVFIKVRRNFLYTAQSIYFGRKEFFGDENMWFSARPKNFFKIKNHSPLRQVCEQILFIEKDIEDGAKKIGKCRIFDINYESFCNDPKKNIDSFIDFYSDKTGIQLKKRSIIPSCFTPSKNIKISKKEFQQLEAIAKEIQLFDC